MSKLSLIIFVGFIGLISGVVFAEKNNLIKHNHNGRFHTHPLPKEGLKHSHNFNKNKVNNNLVRIIKNNANTQKNKKYGYYSKDEVKILWLNSGRKARLLETLTFTEPSGKRWVASKGHVIDGASIPKILQPFIGTPYGGNYVMASIIHDVACDEKKRTWKEVHKVFHYAMLASGVSVKKASIMYDGVFKGGPRWGKDAEKRLSEKELKQYLDKSIDSLNIKGKVKNYSGSMDYTGFRNGKRVSGGLSRYNDLTIRTERGGGLPFNGQIYIKKDDFEVGVRTEAGNLVSGFTFKYAQDNAPVIRKGGNAGFANILIKKP